MAETLTIPPAVDVHVHFREPGTNLAESYESGSRAGLLGGVGFAYDMPNTPGMPTWSVASLEAKRDLVLDSAYMPMGLYVGSQPVSDNVGELSHMAPLAAGIKLYGAPTTGNLIDYAAQDFRDTVAEWRRIARAKPIMFHPGAENLEDMIGMVARDRGHHLHVCHVSNMAQVDLIEAAKKRDLPVTAGVTPHHLFLNSQDAHRMGWYGRMQPPLEHQTESEQLWRALVDGRIDIVETDHAPHTRQAKEDAEAENPQGVLDTAHKTCYGVPGIEFVMPLLLRQVVKLDRMSLERLVEVTSSKPADIMGLRLGAGTNTTWDLEEYRIESESDQVQSKAGWTPYLGSLALGRVDSLTIKHVPYVQNGQIVEPRNPGSLLTYGVASSRVG